MSASSKLLVGYAPFIHERDSTPALSWTMVLALLPALAWGFYSFGLRALVVVVTAVASALVGEGLVGLIRHRFTLNDGSAFLTGLLIGLSMPPGVPYAVPALASGFAILLVKGAFGGLGSNWMNPALAGVVFALLNWPEAMGIWLLPRHLGDVAALSGATPLAALRTHTGSALEALRATGLVASGMDERITVILNDGLFRRLGAELPPGYFDLFLGKRSGSIGELSCLFLLIPSIYLIARRIIRWHIPLSILGSYGLAVWIFGGLSAGEGLFSGDILFSFFSGSLFLVAFFMATDPVTSPSTIPGMIVYGIGIGVLTFVLRSYGTLSEGTAFAVVIMNCVVPLLERGKGKPRRVRSSAHVDNEER